MSDETKVRRIAVLINDSFAFVKSQEVNKTLDAVTFDDLLQELIIRNGTSDESKKTEYNPYGYNEKWDDPVEPLAAKDPEPKGNPVSGTPFKNPTKMDRVKALQAAIEQQVEAVKKEEISEDAYKEDSTGVLAER